MAQGLVVVTLGQVIRLAHSPARVAAVIGSLVLAAVLLKLVGETAHRVVQAIFGPQTPRTTVVAVVVETGTGELFPAALVVAVKVDNVLAPHMTLRVLTGLAAVLAVTPITAVVMVAVLAWSLLATPALQSGEPAEP